MLASQVLRIKWQGTHCTACATTNWDSTWCWTTSQDPQSPTEGRAAHPVPKSLFPSRYTGAGGASHRDPQICLLYYKATPGLKSKASLEGESGPLPQPPCLAVLAGPKFCGQWH